MDTKNEEIIRIKRIKKKIAKTESHVQFLDTCIEKKIISKGFKLKWTPAYNIEQIQSHSYQEILQSTSLALMKDTKEINMKKLLQLRRKEKEIAERSGFKTPQWFLIKNTDDLITASKSMNKDGILKKRIQYK